MKLCQGGKYAEGVPEEGLGAPGDHQARPRGAARGVHLEAPWLPYCSPSGFRGDF